MFAFYFNNLMELEKFSKVLFKPSHFIVAALQKAASRKTILTKQELGYYVFN